MLHKVLRINLISAAKPMHFGGNVKQRDRGKSVDTAIGSQFEMADDSGEETVPPPPPIEEESGKADRKHGDDSSVAVEEKALTKAAIVGLGITLNSTSRTLALPLDP